MKDDRRLVPFDTHQRGVEILSEEAREHFVPRECSDWDALERRIAEASRRPRVRRPTRAAGLTLAATFGVAALAAATVVWIFKGGTPKVPSVAVTAEGSAVAPAKQLAALPTFSVRGMDDGARLEQDDKTMGAGEDVSLDRPLRVTSGGAFLVRDAREGQGRVALWLSSDTVARVELRDGYHAVVVSSGSVELDVEPTTKSLAFAVETDNARVLVRGTHFRVSYSGGRTTVDLHEGRIGVLAGSAEEQSVRAPAHVVVRDQGQLAQASISPGTIAPPAWTGLVPDYRRAPEASPSATISSNARARTIPKVAPSGRAPEALSADPVGRITQAAETCVRRHGGASPERARKQTVLTLDVGAGGRVRFAVFSPPPAPEVQACITEVIYSLTFASPGPVRVPLAL